MSTVDKIRALVDARGNSPDPKIPSLNIKPGDTGSPSTFTPGTNFIQKSTVVGTPTKIPGSGGGSSRAGSSGRSSSGSSKSSSPDGGALGTDFGYGSKDKNDLTGTHFKGTFNRPYGGYR
jgi:hypothetical protein